MSLSHIRRQRERLAERKKKGLCTRCGGERDSEEHLRCQNCRDYARRYDRSRRVRWPARDALNDGLHPLSYEPSWHPQRDINNSVGGVG